MSTLIACLTHFLAWRLTINITPFARPSPLANERRPEALDVLRPKRWMSQTTYRIHHVGTKSTKQPIHTFGTAISTAIHGNSLSLKTRCLTDEHLMNVKYLRSGAVDPYFLQSSHAKSETNIILQIFDPAVQSLKFISRVTKFLDLQVFEACLRAPLCG